MYLGYQNGTIKFYTETPLDEVLYSLDKVVETQDEYVLDGDSYVLKDKEWEDRQELAEKERIAMLSLTRGDVFRGLLLAKGLTRTQLRQQLEVMPTSTQEDIVKRELALIDFDEALDFYRGNPLIDTVGLALGITSKQLDRFFDTKDYKYLTNCTFTVNATPIEAIVTINNIVGNKLTIPYGGSVEYEVTCEGYFPYIGRIDNVVENTEISVVLEPLPEVEGEVDDGV